MNILIADDDPVVRDVASRYVRRDGHDVQEASTGSEALAVLASHDIDLAILDIMMPGPDGLEICRSVREGTRPRLPIILLTALGDEEDRVLGLEVGADDYVVKPFSPRELALRVASLLRRAALDASGPTAVGPDARIARSGSVVARIPAREVLVEGNRVALTSREFDLLVFLLQHPGVVHGREELLRQVWGWDFGDLSTVTVHIKRVRAKLGAAHRIRTVWGQGYTWDDHAD
ncbi:response regulator transcription factor [Lolliginicoccus suaedae]|uniref:response regulator transcription factor n=1 Tax=Lolliginicoccus suaedae TaxID=2605429 RepID=UPI0011EE559D|nr:response regulator transcription factor [Lolliginicoccus suaedae]